MDAFPAGPTWERPLALRSRWCWIASLQERVREVLGRRGCDGTGWDGSSAVWCSRAKEGAVWVGTSQEQGPERVSSGGAHVSSDLSASPVRSSKLLGFRRRFGTWVTRAASQRHSGWSQVCLLGFPKARRDEARRFPSAWTGPV